MVYKILFFQTLLGSLGLAFSFGLPFDTISFVWGWLLAQSYGLLFLFLGKLIFYKKAKGITLSVIALKWVFLVFILYSFLKFVQPLGFFIGLFSFVSFFGFYGFLSRE